MHLSTSPEKLSVRKQERSHPGEIHYTSKEDLSLETEWGKKKSHFVINPHVLLLCNLEVSPKVHLQQLCLHDQLYIFCNRWSETAFLRRSKGIELAKPRVANAFLLLFWILPKWLGIECTAKFVLVSSGFLRCFFNQPFTSNCCTSPLAPENKNKHTGPDKAPLLTQLIHFLNTILKPHC